MKCLSRTIVLSILLSIFSGPCLGVIPLVFIGTGLGLGGAGVGATLGTGAITGFTLGGGATAIGIGAGAAGAGVATGVAAVALGAGAGAATTATVATTAIATGTGFGLGAGLTAIGTKLGITAIGSNLGLTTITTKFGLVGLTKAIGIGTVFSFFVPSSSSNSTTTTSNKTVSVNTSSSSHSKTVPVSTSNSSHSNTVPVNTSSSSRKISEKFLENVRTKHDIFFGLLGSSTSSSNSSSNSSNSNYLNYYNSLDRTKPDNSSSILNLLLVGGSLGVGGLALVGKTELGEKLAHDGRDMLYAGIANLGKKLKLSDIGNTLGLKKVITDIGKNFEWNKFTTMTGLSTFFGLVGASGSNWKSKQKLIKKNTNTDTLKNIVKKTANRMVEDIQSHQTTPIIEKPTTTTTTTNTDNLSLKSSSKSSSNITYTSNNISNCGSSTSNAPTNISGGTDPIDSTVQKLVNKVVTKLKPQELLKESIAPLMQNTTTTETTNTPDSLDCTYCAKKCMGFPNPFPAMIRIVDGIGEACSAAANMLGFGDSSRPPDIKTVSVHDKSCDAVGMAKPISANDRNIQLFVSTVPPVAHRAGDPRQIIRKTDQYGNEYFVDLQTKHEVAEGSEKFRQQLKDDADDFIRQRKKEQQQFSKPQQQPIQQPVQLLGQIPVQQTTVQQIPVQQSQAQVQPKPLQQSQVQIQQALPQQNLPQQNPPQTAPVQQIPTPTDQVQPKITSVLNSNGNGSTNNPQIPDLVNQKPKFNQLNTLGGDFSQLGFNTPLITNTPKQTVQQKPVQLVPVKQNTIQPEPIQEKSPPGKLIEPPKPKTIKEEFLEKIPMLVVHNITEVLRQQSQSQEQSIPLNTTTVTPNPVKQSPVQQTPDFEAKRETNIKLCLAPLEKYAKKDSLGKRIFEFIFPETANFTSEVFTEAGISAAIEPVADRLLGKTTYKMLKMPYTIVARIQKGNKGNKPLESLYNAGVAKFCYSFGGDKIQKTMGNMLTTGARRSLFGPEQINLFAAGQNIPLVDDVIPVSPIMRSVFTPSLNSSSAPTNDWRRLTRILKRFSSKVAHNFGIKIQSNENDLQPYPTLMERTWYNGVGNKIIKDSAPLVAEVTTDIVTDMAISAVASPIAGGLLGKAAPIMLKRIYPVVIKGGRVRKKVSKYLLPALIGRYIYHGCYVEELQDGIKTVQDGMKKIITTEIEAIGDGAMDAKIGAKGLINALTESVNEEGIEDIRIPTLPTFSPLKMAISIVNKAKDAGICNIQ